MGNNVGEDVVVDLVGGSSLAVRGEEEGADVAAEVWILVDQLVANNEGEAM